MRNFIFKILSQMIMTVCKHESHMKIQGATGEDRMVTFCPDCGKVLEDD